MIRRRRVTNDPSRDVPRSIDTARESKKKGMPPRSRSYLVRTLKCVRVRGGFVSGAGKCGERAREQPGRWMAAASHSKS
jgi:hypothetical protein